MENTFNVIIPAELSKSKNGDWRIRGLATTGSRDRQGEILKPEGVDLSPITEGTALLNWEHGSAPEDQIGLLDGYSRENNEIYVEGKLFKKHTRAKAVREIMESLEDGGDVGRLGMSVQGQIVKRNDANDKIVEKCIIDAVALTLKPVNTDTHVSLIKSMTAAESLNFSNPPKNTYTTDQVVDLLVKALGVGAGGTQAPDTRTGGDALALENFDSKKKKKPVDVSKAEEGYEFKIERILSQLQEVYPNESRAVLWTCLKERLNQSMVSNKTI